MKMPNFEFYDQAGVSRRPFLTIDCALLAPDMCHDVNGDGVNDVADRAARGIALRAEPEK